MLNSIIEFSVKTDISQISKFTEKEIVYPTLIIIR